MFCWQRFLCRAAGAGWAAAAALIVLTGCQTYQPRPLDSAASAAALEARRLDTAALRSFLETNAPEAVSEWPRRSWDFETLTLVAFYYHPSLEVARAEWRLAGAGVETAAGRLNPTVSVAPAYDKQIPDNPTPWMVPLTFDVPIETAGKRRRRMEQAQHLSEAARLNLAATAWQVRSGLRASLVDYEAAARRVGLLRAQITVQEQSLNLLEQRRAAGALSQAEVLPTRLNLQKLRLDLSDAQRLNVESRARLAEALGVPVAALDGVSFDFDLTRQPAADRLASAEVRQAALMRRTDILGALADYAATQSALQLEIARQYPDLHLGPGYAYNSGSAGDNQWQLGVTLELPLLNRNQGPIAEAEARRAAAAARFNALQARVIAEIDRTVAAYRVSQQILVEAQALLAAQRRQRDAVRQQFNAGAADQLDLLTAEVELAAGELAVLDGEVKFQQAFDALEDAVQQPLDKVNWSAVQPAGAVVISTKEQQP